MNVQPFAGQGHMHVLQFREAEVAALGETAGRVGIDVAAQGRLLGAIGERADNQHAGPNSLNGRGLQRHLHRAARCADDGLLISLPVRSRCSEHVEHG